jgi:hypothetical protein
VGIGKIGCIFVARQMRGFTSTNWHVRSDVRVRLDNLFKIKHRDNAIVPSFSVRVFPFLFFLASVSLLESAGRCEAMWRLCDVSIYFILFDELGSYFSTAVDSRD